MAKKINGKKCEKTRKNNTILLWYSVLSKYVDSL